MFTKGLRSTIQAAAKGRVMGAASAGRSTAARAAMSTTTEGTAMEGAGEMVFTEDRMKAHLSPATFDAFVASTKSGESLTKEQANEVAGALKEWAMSKGCVQYSHWFMPVRGMLAGVKHDSFIDIDYSDSRGVKSIELADFSGGKLFMGETDGSSFPNGGMRATHTAAAFCSWDKSSPPFVRNDTLYIPSVFVSHYGKALDQKTPLLRSQRAVNDAGKRLLHKLGDEDVGDVMANVGCEQEFFMVDKENFLQRPDLMATGRTLVGAPSPLGQELDNNYFTNTNPRVKAFLADFQEEMWSLGSSYVVHHNEVAPSQHEWSPIFTVSNVASDNNIMSGEVMNEVAAKHGLVALLHEKPFAGINGSGKHNNWGLNTDTGDNLFVPGKTEHKQARFIALVACLARTIHVHGDTLRASVGTAGNDHRLGAQEAPPAIMSLYTGLEMEKHLQAVIDGGDLAGYNPPAKSIDVGSPAVQGIPANLEDRNRTAPFPFCGNRFEFRAVGSNQNISWPLTVLNAGMAESMDVLSAKLDAGEDLRDAVAGMLKEHWPAVFNGNGYDPAWHKEAVEERGLINLANTPAALANFGSAKDVELFGKTGVFEEDEVHARKELLQEEYTATILVEATCLLNMMNQGALGACAKDIADFEAAPTLAGPRKDAYEQLAAEVAKLNDAIDALEGIEGAEAQSLYCGSTLRDQMDATRQASDVAENLCSADYWPFPSYQELLFSHQYEY